MMKILKLNYTNITLMLGMLIVFTACDHSVLDKAPLDQPSDDAVWEDDALTQAFLNDIYDQMPTGFSEFGISSHTDEARFTHGPGANVAQGIVDPSNLIDDTTWGWEHWGGPPAEGNFMWGSIYSTIRKVNIFFENFDPDEFDDPVLAEQLIGEAHFLRAVQYHNLARQWGGVPIIDQVYELGDDMDEPRATFEEVVEFVVDDANKAAERLNWEGREDGRANRAAALALKSRMLVHAASDLYHNTGEWAGGYGHPELVGYVNGSQEDLWERARDAADIVMNNSPYGLYNENPDPTENFRDIWLEGGGNEAIMSRFHQESWDGAQDWGQLQGPNGYFLWSGNNPTQQLVDAFETTDGEEFDWSNPDHAESPYEDRDPRLEATVMYDGYEWQQRPEGPRATDPVGRYEAFQFIDCVGSEECPDQRGGLDTRNSVIEDWNGSHTGYVINKFLDDEVTHWNETQEVPWHYFRYAEVLLNYAEAQIGLNNEGDARDALNQLRERAGMPDITASGQDLVDQYRNERRIELAFEQHRYFDVRRWMIAPEVEDEDSKGIYFLAEYEYDPDAQMNGMYNYERVLEENPPDNVEPTAGNPNIGIRPVWDRSWNPATYKLPIYRDEMNRNSALVQNPNY